MTTVMAWGSATADVFGLVLLVALVASLLIASACWVGVGLDKLRIVRARRRFSREAIAEAEAAIRSAAPDRRPS